MGKKKQKKKNNSLKLAIQAQKKKRLQLRDMEKLFSEAREIVKEKEKKWHIWYPMIFYKKGYGEQSKKEDNIKKEDISELKPYKLFQTKFRNFVLDLFDIKDLVELLMMNSKENLKIKSNELNKIIEDNIIVKNDKIAISYFNNKNYDKWRSIKNDIFLLGTSWEKIYKNFFIYLLTIYENFLQDMMKFILNTYPWKLWKEKKLSYDDFKKYSTIEEIENFYIETNISDNMKWNTLDKFRKFDNLLDNNDIFKLMDILPISNLVEINSRRNLYVHNEWIINNQYITNCNEWWLCWENLIIGKELVMNKEYFLASFYTIIETVLKIAYIVFCKCFSDKEEIQKFDDEFNSLIVDYLIPKYDEEKVSLSKKILQFLYDFINNKPEHNDTSKQLFIINLALCNKILWDKNECKKALNLRNRSKTTPNFQLANFVLMENRKSASELIKLCSCIKKVENKFTKKDYQILPIFFEFKKTEEFKEKYKEFYWFDFYEEDNLT